MCFTHINSFNIYNDLGKKYALSDRGNNKRGPPSTKSASVLVSNRNEAPLKPNKPGFFLCNVRFF